MKHIVFSSQQASYREFGEQLCDQIGVDAPSSAPPSFDLSARLVQLGDSRLMFLENRGKAIEVSRTPRRIATDPEEAWVIGICLDGSQVVSLDSGSELVARRSGLFIARSDVPMAGVTTPGTRLGLLILPDGPPRPGWAPTYSNARAGLARVLSDSLRAMFEELPTLGAPELRSLLNSLLPLASAVAAPSAHTREQARSSVREAHRRRVVRFIEANLGDPRLGARWIADSLRMSTRGLHALFADAEMTVGETILSLRLERCRAALLDPANAHRSVFELALAFGFSDPSHFSRAYRRRFGVSPRDERASLRPAQQRAGGRRGSRAAEGPRRS